MSQRPVVDFGAFRDGDERVFRRVVEEYSPRLLAVVRPFAADADDAHDLLQDTWRRAFVKRRTFTGTGSLLGWLYAVCRSVCLSSARARSVRAAAPLVPGGEASDPPIDPLTAAEGSDLQRAVREAVLDLPARERDVVVLRMLEQRSTRETADALGCADGTVKAALHHALGKLRISMEVWVR